MTQIKILLKQEVIPFSVTCIEIDDKRVVSNSLVEPSLKNTLGDNRIIETLYARCQENGITPSNRDEIGK